MTPLRIHCPLLVLLLAAFALVCQAWAQETPPVQEAGLAEAAALIDVLEARDDASTFLELLQRTGLDAALRDGGPYTLLVPTDEAFAALPEGALEAMDEAEVLTVLRRHIVAGAVPAEAVMRMDEVPTVAGDVFAVAVADDGVSIGPARVVEADVAAADGLIHVIDAILMPAEAMDIEE